MGRVLSEEQRKWLAKRIGEAEIARNWTNLRLAEKAGYDERTVRNILAGYSAKFETYANVCMAVDLDISKLLDAVEKPRPEETAPEQFGGYTRKMYEAYEGEYVTIRPNYKDASIIRAFLTRIYWNASQSCYCFEERERVDPEYSQRGHIYFPLGSSYLYLMTIDKGWVRTAVVSQMVAGTDMRGLIISQFNIAGPTFVPVCAPIAYLKMEMTAKPSFGELNATDRQYDFYMRILQETMQRSFARVTLPTAPAPQLNVVSLSNRQSS